MGQVVPPMAAQGGDSSTHSMPQVPWGWDALWDPGLVGDPIPRARPCLVLLGNGEAPGKGLLWKHPAATGCHIPSQPSCEALGGEFRDWRLSSEHQFCGRGGLSSGINSCKRIQRERELLTGKRWALCHRLQARRAKNQNKKRDQSKVWTRPKEDGGKVGGTQIK